MAHAGTPTDLAKQPATSTTNGLWQAFLAGIVILAIAAGMVFVASNLASSKNAAPAVDHRLDAIEGQRGATSLSVGDGSYDAVEAQRGATFLLVDGSMNQVEDLRGGASLTGSAGATSVSAPTGYDQVEKKRGGVIFP